METRRRPEQGILAGYLPSFQCGTCIIFTLTFPAQCEIVHRPWKDWSRYSPNTAAFSIYKTLLEISSITIFTTSKMWQRNNQSQSSAGQEQEKEKKN